VNVAAGRQRQQLIDGRPAHDSGDLAGQCGGDFSQAFIETAGGGHRGVLAGSGAFAGLLPERHR